MPGPYDSFFTNDNATLYLASSGVADAANPTAAEAEAIAVAANKAEAIQSFTGGDAVAGTPRRGWSGDSRAGGRTFNNIAITADYKPSDTDIDALATDADIIVVREFATTDGADDATYLVDIGKVAFAPINNVAVPDASSSDDFATISMEIVKTRDTAKLAHS